MGDGSIRYNSNVPENTVFIQKTMAATDVTTTPGPDITTRASGKFMVTFAQVRTDGVSLAPTTDNVVNLVIAGDVAQPGDSKIISSTVGALGSQSSVTQTTPYVVDSNERIGIVALGSSLTSTGNITVDVVLERLDNGASIRVTT